MLEPAFLAAANERGHPLATRKSDEPSSSQVSVES